MPFENSRKSFHSHTQVQYTGRLLASVEYRDVRVVGPLSHWTTLPDARTRHGVDRRNRYVAP